MHGNSSLEVLQYSDANVRTLSVIFSLGRVVHDVQSKS